MKITLKNIESSYYKEAVKIFTKAFASDPLHLFAFPDAKERLRITKLVYELVILAIVPEMKLKIKGAFVDGRLKGAIIYTPPDRKFEWNEKMDKAVSVMRKKAKNENIRLIGEYAMTSGKLKPRKPHFYLNELAVLPEMQGNGIGTKLMLSVEPECRKHPAAVGLALDTTNIRNVNLYKKIGYKVRKEFDFYELKGYCMFKSIIR
jgi:hypothetical protein